MRAVAVGFMLIGFAGASPAQPQLYGSPAGKYTAAFPGQPKETEKTASTAVGEVKVTILTYASADGNVFMVSYADFPTAATKPENHKTLLDGIRDGVKGRDGKLSGEEKALEHGADKLPGREFVVEKGKQRVKMRVFVSGSRVYQVAAIGTESFTTGKDGTAFLDSISITK